MPLLTLVGKFHFTVFCLNFGKQNPFYCFYCGSANFTGRSWLNFCTFCFDNIFLHSIVDFGGSCPHSHAHLCHHTFGHFSNFRSQLSQLSPKTQPPQAHVYLSLQTAQTDHKTTEFHNIQRGPNCALWSFSLQK